MEIHTATNGGHIFKQKFKLYIFVKLKTLITRIKVLNFDKMCIFKTLFIQIWQGFNVNNIFHLFVLSIKSKLQTE